MNSITEQELKGVVAGYFNELTDAFELGRAQTGPLTEGEWRDEKLRLKETHLTLKGKLKRRDYTGFTGAAEYLLGKAGVALNDMDHQSSEFKKLRRDFLKAMVFLLKQERKRHRGELLEDMDFLLQPVAQSTSFADRTSLLMPEETSIPISILFDEFKRERLAGNQWREKTRRANEAMAGVMIEILGDQPVGKMDKGAGREFKTALQQYPVNRNKDPRYSGKSLAQIRVLKDVETIAVQTINNYLNKATALFGWAVNQGYSQVNPFEGLRISMGVRVKDQVLPFDSDDLEKIFNAPLYRNNEYNRPHQFWLPLIGLYSGARLEEICQLHVGDIKQIDGVGCFDICEDEERKLKTRSSERVVPIHPYLIDVGFLKYVDRMQKQKRKKLFPELNRHNGKISHGASQWFGKYKRGLGFPERKKVFHSFRHTVISMLRKKRVPDHEVKMPLAIPFRSPAQDGR